LMTISLAFLIVTRRNARSPNEPTAQKQYNCVSNRTIGSGLD
jgi:hypothetical protein